MLLTNLPLFYFMRFLFTLWLVLPQFQGASQIYAVHVRPFLSQHQQDIDKFITEAHDKIKGLGGEYVARVIEFVRNQLAVILGVGSVKWGPDITDVNDVNNVAEASTSAQPAHSYADMLFSKFKNSPSLNLPEGYSLGALLSPLASKSPAAYFSSIIGGHGAGLPSSLRTKADKLNYIKEQRLKLMELISSLDEHTKALENEDEPDPDYDVVKKDEAEEVKGDRDKEDTEKETEEVSKGWFSWK